MGEGGRIQRLFQKEFRCTVCKERFTIGNIEILASRSPAMKNVIHGMIMNLSARTRRDEGKAELSGDNRVGSLLENGLQRIPFLSLSMMIQKELNFFFSSALIFRSPVEMIPPRRSGK